MQKTNLVPAIEERTVSGSSVSFNSAFALPLKACKVSFSATQAGSGEPSPSNPRAISGVSAIGLTANSTPVSVSLGDTRYGGELDVLTGELTINYTEIVFNGTEIWNTYGGTVGYYCLLRDMKLGRYGNGLSNRFKIISSNTQLGIMLGYDNRIAYFCQINQNISEVTDLATWKTWLSNNNVELVYPLDEPITIQLSANELSSIIGNNTFSTDTGTLEITFADLQEKSASGSVATFNTALAMPLASCNIAVNAWQEGSGDPNPIDNIRPIHGFSEVNLTRCGKNLFDKNAIQTGKWINLQTGSIENQAGYAVTDFIYVKANTRYSWVSGGSSRKWFYDVDKNPISVIGASTNYITPTQDGYVCLTLALNQIDLDTIIFVVGNLPDTYEPYVTPTIYTIQLGQEVYGAEVDADGVAHCTHRYIDFNNVEFLAYTSGGTTYYCSNDGNVVGYNGDNICSCFKKSSVNNIGNMDNLSFIVRAGVIYFRNTDYISDLEGFIASVRNNGIVVELAEPFDIQLTPTQIETIRGNNTIFADTGDVDLTFKDLDIAKRGNFREVFRLPS